MDHRIFNTLRVITHNMATTIKVSRLSFNASKLIDSNLATQILNRYFFFYLFQEHTCNIFLLTLRIYIEHLMQVIDNVPKLHD
jgi:hypothetical protein